MSVLLKDQSAEESNPVRFFLFERGTTAWRYVALPNPVTFMGHVWTPAVITTGSVEATNDFLKDTLTVNLPISDAFAATYLGYPLDLVTRLTVYRSNVDELTDSVVDWRGRVASSSVNGGLVSLECEPILSRLKHAGLRATISKTCRHVLFGPGCGLVASSHLLTGQAVASVEGVNIAVPSVAETTGNGPYTGGVLVAPDGTLRTITRHNTIFLTLISPIPSLIAAWAATPGAVNVGLYMGCDRSPESCQRLNNYGNFGGFRDMPTENPFTVAII